MTEMDLKKMSKKELIDLVQTLQNKEADYEDKIAAMEKQLEDRSIRIAEAGSIADAAIRVNKVFEDAQAAASQYLAEIEKMKTGAKTESDRLIAEAQAQADQTTKEAQTNADEVLAAANSKAEKIVKEANITADTTLKAADAAADDKVKAAEKRAQIILEETDESVKEKTKLFEQQVQESLAAYSKLPGLLQEAWTQTSEISSNSKKK